MSGATAPGGLSLKEFKLYAVETGQWLWGTAQGAFNEKQTLSQIITDAVIGMIPVVGDVTAVRDIIAVSMGLATEPAKRDKPTEWLLLVIFIFALIPVFGGVIKGVGRIAIRVTDDVAKNAPEIAKLGGEMIAFLNRLGHKNAEAWLKALDVLKYEAEILGKFRTLCDTVILSINTYIIRFKAVLPQSLVARAQQIAQGFKEIKTLGERKIPQALKDLNEKLEYIKKVIHAGGVPPVNKAATVTAQTGQKTVSFVEEARLVESGAAKRIARGGKHPQNLANADPKLKYKIDEVYKKEDGFPDLLRNKVTDEATGVSYYSAIAAAKGPIKNEMLSGETLFRAFGPKGKLHNGVEVNATNPIGLFWGRGNPPKAAKEWRESYAVLDEFNLNGWLSVIKIPPDIKLPACTSTVSEQYSKKAAGQFLEGGGKQAAIDKLFEKQIQDIADQLYKRGGGKATLPNGIEIEIKQSGWSGINNKIGYADTIIPGASMTERLGVTEIQGKVAQEGVKQSVQAAGSGTAKDKRAAPNR